MKYAVMANEHDGCGWYKMTEFNYESEAKQYVRELEQSMVVDYVTLGLCEQIDFRVEACVEV